MPRARSLACALALACFLPLVAACPKGGGDTSATGELLYCPDVPEVPAPCDDDGDCATGSAYCSPYPNDCPGAGCPSDCEGDDECGEGSVCEYTGTGCCANDTRTCVPACSEGTCPAGDTCDATGHCVPLPCDGGGYSCPEGSSCAPTAAGADAHGCALIPCDEAGALPCAQSFTCTAGACQRITCMSTDDCPCGTCVKGECWERPWLCTEPSA